MGHQGHGAALIPTNRILPHPSEIAWEEFGVVFDGDVTPLMAAVLAAKTKTSAELWRNLQANYDASKARQAEARPVE